MTTDNLIWSARADLAQRSLAARFGAPWPQLYHNWSPSSAAGDAVFNYWWLAHVIDVRLDAYERTGDPAWLDGARAVRRNILERNQGSLYNDYFDDMLWFGLALERLGRLGDDAGATADAAALWERCRTLGWNATCGWSLAWRATQLDYKNTPANGPFAILGARLFEASGQQMYLEHAVASFEWISRTLMPRGDGFVEDGINRLGDGAIDTPWQFTYNQGLYIGAGVALYRATGEPAFLDRVQPTATTALAVLGDGTVFHPEGDGGDEGLFKGVFYRYAEQLLRVRPDVGLTGFIAASVDALWDRGVGPDGDFAPGNDWRTPPAGPVPYSTYLSAIMATEVRAALSNRPT
jgi:predicted alpha-1,6-mannanase (GH76 family)